MDILDLAAPQVAQIEKGVEWALEQRRNGRSVYVHCAHGHGRSVTVMCACLLKSGHVGTFNEAMKIIKSKRPKVKMNSRQNAMFKAWLEEHQENGVQR